MLNITVSLFNMSSEFLETLVPSVENLLIVRCTEWCTWLLSELLKNDWLHLCTWYKFMPT